MTATAADPFTKFKEAQRGGYDAMAIDIFEDNTVRLQFLITRATKV